jgi:hypothetical protein
MDEATALALHPTTGDVYVAGSTSSTNFPKTTGGAQGRYGGGERDAFVARLNSSLTQILQSTYLGGSGMDEARALAIHPKTGDVYVAGWTWSTNFPKTTGGAQTGHRGGFEDAFVARLNSSLTQIFQSTYLGGSGMDEATALALHPTTGDVYVAGSTSSTNFPKTTGGAQGRYGGGERDAFVARLNSSLTQIFQSAYLGGSDMDGARALAIHPKTGNVYVAGGTWSTNFPKTTGGAQRSNGGPLDAFVARLNSSLTQILQSTYLGGRGMDEARALAIHPKTGNVYVAGSTSSTDFPKTTGGAQTMCNNCDGEYGDAFVARLTADLAAGRKSSDGGGFYITSSASSVAGLWNILVWLSVPVFVLVRRVRRR